MYRRIRIFALLLSLASPQVQAQLDLPELYDIGGEFAFVRIQYDSYYSGGFYGGPWATDFPAADENFLRGVARLSRSEEHTSELQSRSDLVCRLLL